MVFLIKRCPRYYQKDIYELIRSFCPDALIGMEGQCDLDLFLLQNTYTIFCSDLVAQTQIITQVNVIQNEKKIDSFSEKIEIADAKYSSKALIKRSIARHIYQWMTNLTKRTLKWGIITGMRPVQIARNFLMQKNDDTACFNYLSAQYLLSQEKAKKLIEVAHQQQHLIDRSLKNVSVYIHIPFCLTKCFYCSFGTATWKSSKIEQSAYVDALIKEIQIIDAFIKQRRLHVESIYIGGGTPTTLDNNNLERLLTDIAKRFADFEEFTVEAGRPDTITKEKLSIIRQAGVTRLSINPQTMNDATLKRVGRAHTVNEFLFAYNLARDMKFDNINCDLIIGLPGETKGDMMQSIGQIKGLQPESITIHALAIKKGANYSYLDVSAMNQTEVEACIDDADQLLGQEQYSAYYLYRQKKMVGSTENTGYCKQNKECRYNVHIMEGTQTILAIGAGAISRIKAGQANNEIIRIANMKDPNLYVKQIDQIIDKKKEKLKEIVL
jgi:oxygen-independent coproporphyrinogen-3 oxidase